MNPPELPGFYYDREKRKYFKIQPDHRLPPNAKHAFGNIVKEERAKQRQSPASGGRSRGKSRKKRPRRELRPVARAAIFRSSHVSNATLSRELGRQSFARNIADANAVLSSQSTVSSRISANGLATVNSTVVAAVPKPERGRLIVLGDKAIRDLYWDNVCKKDGLAQDVCLEAMAPSAYCKIAPHTSFSWWPARDPQEILECRYSSPQLSYAITPIEDLHSTMRRRTVVKAVHYHMAISNDTPLRPTTFVKSESGNYLAAAVEQHILVVDLDANVKAARYRCKDFVRSICFMSPTVLAADEGHRVRFEDVRAPGHRGIFRFENDKQITGLKPVNEHQLLLADNHSVKLFDTRFSFSRSSRPALLFDVRQELSHAKMDVNEQGIVAVYGEQCVSLLSLKQGSHLRTVELRGSQRGSPITDLSWWKDVRGVPYVQACIGDRIHRLSPSTARSSPATTVGIHDDDTMMTEG